MTSRRNPGPVTLTGLFRARLEWCIVNFQKSTGGERFYVNVGVQPLFVPSEGTSCPIARDTSEAECIFRSRVDPPEDLFGWLHTLDASIVALFRQRLKEKLHSFIQPLMDFPGQPGEASAHHFDGLGHPLFGGRHARTFLHFSRIALAHQRKDIAAAFAKAGMGICPERATTWQSELKVTLRIASTQPPP